MKDDITDQLAKLVDAKLLDWLQNGREMVGPDGAPILDESGNVARRDLNASEMDKVLKRLAQLGSPSSMTGSGGSADRLREAARRHGLKLAGRVLPPVSEEPDKGTGT